MEFLLQTIQGPYSYLVIFQVLVVSALLLMMIWFMIKRTLRQEALAGAQQAALFTVPAQKTERNEAPPVSKKRVELEPSAEDERQPKLEKEPVVSGAVPTAAQVAINVPKEMLALQEKVTFLETKLLEYEMIQEEIGNLKGLKQENESLKAKLASLGQALPKAESTPKKEAKAEKKTPPVKPGKKPLGKVSDAPAREPKFIPQKADTENLPPEPQGVIGSTSDEDLKEPKLPAVKTAPTKPQEPKESETPKAEAKQEAKSAVDASNSVLAGILDQLDELSKEDEKKKTGS